MTSTVSFPLTAQQVRDFMSLDTDATSRYSDQTIGSNIRSAVGILERHTKRFLADRTQTLTFTTNGADLVTIPGLRVPGAITKAGTALTQDESYFLSPDAHQTGLFTAISFGQSTFRADGPPYLHNSGWFDTNADQAYRQGRGSLPNDLTIPGDWGFEDATMPDEVILAVKVLAAHLTILGDANTGGIRLSPGGVASDIGAYPDVVQNFIAEWALPLGVQGA